VRRRIALAREPPKVEDHSVDVTIRYADSPRVFGVLLVPQRAEIVARVGEAAMSKALLRLPREQRDEYANLRADQWCRSETAERVIIEVAAVSNLDARDLVDESVHGAIRKSVGKLWRALLVMTSDFSLIDRTPMFYARIYDRGTLIAERTSPGHATLELAGWADVPELHCVAIAAGVRAVLELAGRVDVEATFVQAVDRARFAVSWKV
jgi:hypothetical protein